MIVKYTNNIIYVPNYFLDVSTVFIFLLNYCIFSKTEKVKFIASISKKIQDIKSEEEMTTLIENLFLLEDSKELPEYKAWSLGLFQNHFDTCMFVDCPLKNHNIETCIKDINKFNSTVDPTHRPFFLFLGECFHYLEIKFKDYYSFHFYHLFFLLFKVENISLALVELQNISQFKMPYKKQYVLYNISLLTNNKLLKSNKYFKVKEKMVGDIIDVIYFDELYNKLKKLIFVISDLKKNITGPY